MRNRLFPVGVLLVLAVGGLATWSILRGQDATSPTRPPNRPGPTITSPRPDEPAAVEAPSTPSPLVADAERAKRDPVAATPLQQQLGLSLQRGAEWLFQMNLVDGRFLIGHDPALNRDRDGDHFLHQAGAAYALARAAGVTSDPRYAARATQAVVLLLSETATDSKDPRQRYTTLPAPVLDRVASSGLLVLAINMLPAPQKDLLEQSEQLCNYLRLQQRPDGSLRCADLVFDAAPSLAMEEASACHAGQALYGLMASYRHRPEAWKLDVVRKAIAFYTPAWTAHRSLAMAPWHCAAYATAFEVTKDKTFADAVFVMADWLGGLQYDRLDPRHPEWWGGFQTVSEGKPAGGAPDVGSATAAECLAEACRVARLAPDAARADRYEASLDLSLQFLSRLQYTPGNTRHFADWYRPKLLGGFYASPTDGTLRLDATQHVVCALAGYCAYVSAPIQQHARAIP